MTGRIYLIISPAQDAGKIGYATNSDERLTKAQTNNPDYLELVCDFPGDRALEGAIHDALRPKLHIHGDWFRDVERLQLFMGELSDASEAAEHDGENPVPTVAMVKKSAGTWLSADLTLEAF